jgi:hypothetical protein
MEKSLLVYGETSCCDVAVTAEISSNWGGEDSLKSESHFKGFNGGRYWDRTSDPCDVNTVLYR